MDARHALAKRIEFLTRSPLWALTLEGQVALLFGAPRLNMVDPTAEWECAKPTVQGKGKNKMAVIPIQGVLSKDGPAYYGSNYDTITGALESAGSDPDVKRIVLAVDSPGGDVAGLQETSDVLQRVAKSKPVSAIVEGTSASAAYWLTSQAHDVTLTPSGEVGSVGVRMMHVDISKMLDDAGYKVTELFSGDFKTEWSPFKPLSEEAIADMQPRLQSLHNDFIGAVATGRGDRVTQDIKDRRFGEGRMFGSQDAKAHGLVDSIQAPREAFRSLMPPQEEDMPAFGFKRARLQRERSRRAGL